MAAGQDRAALSGPDLFADPRCDNERHHQGSGKLCPASREHRFELALPEQHRDSDPDDKDRYPARTNEEGHRRRHHASLIESMNARLRKVTRNRGQFPSEQAALKVLYLAVRNLEEFRTPNLGSAVPGGKSAAGIHDLLRRPNLNP